VFQAPTATLSTLGRNQAERLAERLATTGVARIVCSDYLRAEETARAVSLKTGVPIEFESSLRERDFGDLRGQSYDVPGFNPFAPDFMPPNGESRAQFLQRIAAAWTRITALTAQTDGKLLVMTHGQVCRALVQNHVDAASVGVLPPMWFNTSVTEIESRAPWRALRVNCVAHLPLQSPPRGIDVA
jgi:broad specificity phosphatase PhoE